MQDSRYANTSPDIVYCPTVVPWEVWSLCRGVFIKGSIVCTYVCGVDKGCLFVGDYWCDVCDDRILMYVWLKMNVTFMESGCHDISGLFCQ